MTCFKSILCASLLTLAISSSAFAGNIHTVAGNIHTVRGNIHTVRGNIHTVRGNIQPGAGNIHGVANIHDLLDVIVTVLLTVV